MEGYNLAVGEITNDLGLGIGHGVAYFITPSIGIELLAKCDAIVGFGSTLQQTCQHRIGFSDLSSIKESKGKA